MKARETLLSEEPLVSPIPEAVAALDGLDETIHQKARLGIMATLLATGEADFKLLKETLALSDGNLSTHLALLEERGYLEARKEFVRRKPRTTYTPTEAGREAFHRYLQTLERIVRATDSHAHQRGTPSPELTIQAQGAGR